MWVEGRSRQGVLRVCVCWVSPKNEGEASILSRAVDKDAPMPMAQGVAAAQSRLDREANGVSNSVMRLQQTTVKQAGAAGRFG